MASSPAAHVAIIGAGVIGMSTALYLQRDGWRVTVVDRVDPGRSCSYGNAAGIALTEVVPISKPGLMMRVPGWLLDPSGPLSIRPYYFPKLLPWLLRFLAQGRTDRVRTLADAAANLSRSVIHDFDTLLKMAGAQDLVQGDCCATIYDHEAEYTKAEWEWRLRAEHGFPCRRISGAEMHELEPDVSPDVGCAVIMDGWRNLTDPYRFVAAMAERFVRDGGALVQGDVRSVDMADGEVRRLRLADGASIAADKLVVAAGAWSHKLARQLGSKVPLEADRGYNKTMPNTGITLGRQLVYETAGLAVTPLEQGLRIGGGVELADVDAPANLARADLLVDKAKKSLPGLRDTSGESWMGPRPGLPDFVPVISASPHVSNVFYAFGHGHVGLTWGPTTGRLIAEMIAGKPGKIDLRPYRIDRF
ncbi:MAG: NAD(P)/FAD-dependent oxidoreductase [Hyphomicrobiales bacterium]